MYVLANFNKMNHLKPLLLSLVCIPCRLEDVQVHILAVVFSLQFFMKKKKSLIFIWMIEPKIL